MPRDLEPWQIEYLHGIKKFLLVGQCQGRREGLEGRGEGDKKREEGKGGRGGPRKYIGQL